MNIDSLKIELIDWIAQLNDQYSLEKISTLKKSLRARKKPPKTKIFGSGKFLVEYISDDFNAPLEAFQSYQK